MQPEISHRKELAFCVLGALEKVFPDTEIPPVGTKEVSLVAAANEYESFQIAYRAGTPLIVYHAECTELSCPEGVPLAVTVLPFGLPSAAAGNLAVSTSHDLTDG